jgi:hypothetical protein
VFDTIDLKLNPLVLTLSASGDVETNREEKVDTHSRTDNTGKERTSR